MIQNNNNNQQQQQQQQSTTTTTINNNNQQSTTTRTNNNNNQQSTTTTTTNDNQQPSKQQLSPPSLHLPPQLRLINQIPTPKQTHKEQIIIIHHHPTHNVVYLLSQITQIPQMAFTLAPLIRYSLTQLSSHLRHFRRSNKHTNASMHQDYLSL